MSAAKRVQQWATFARTWHIFDCKWQDPYESANVIKKYLMGLHKPIYHYPGGATWTLAWELHNKDPTMIIKKAVYRAMKGNLQRRHTMERLLIYPGETVPEDVLQNVTNQIRQTRLVPTRLDQIPEEVSKAYPKVMDYPEDYILK
uniref:SFRICE_038363 n=1 Tax=Spodoptera frugiperda TaxID=7108 RepID=A0A2H1VN45_SPOFR